MRTKWEPFQQFGPHEYQVLNWGPLRTHARTHAHSKAKKIAMKFFRSEMTPPIQKFSGNSSVFVETGFPKGMKKGLEPTIQKSQKKSESQGKGKLKDDKTKGMEKGLVPSNQKSPKKGLSKRVRAAHMLSAPQSPKLRPKRGMKSPVRRLRTLLSRMTRRPPGLIRFQLSLLGGKGSLKSSLTLRRKRSTKPSESLRLRLRKQAWRRSADKVKFCDKIKIRQNSVNHHQSHPKFKFSIILVQWTPKIWGKLSLDEWIFEKWMVWQA